MILSSHITRELAQQRAASLREEGAASRRAASADQRRRGRRPAQRRLSPEEVAACVRSAAAGEQRGYEALVHEFGGLIGAVIRAHRLGEADAADVAQATWLRLFEHLEDLNDPARVGAWLATTARRECLRVLRGARRHVLFGDEVPEVPSTEAAPGDLLIRAEGRATVKRSLGRLRPSDQSLLRLLVAEPRPAYEEIAQALDMPVGSIGPTRARALARLRRELEQEGALEEEVMV